MLIRTSYFYHIRHFLPNMIPVSTCISDPAYYHDGKGKNHIYYDKRGIINGIRFEYMIVQQNIMNSRCPCLEEDPVICPFLKEYKKELDKLDFNYIMERLNWLAEYRKSVDKFEGEPIIVLMVYEAYYNPCSERKPIQQLFQEHGIECKELTYPIN